MANKQSDKTKIWVRITYGFGILGWVAIGITGGLGKWSWDPCSISHWLWIPFGICLSWTILGFVNAWPEPELTYPERGYKQGEEDKEAAKIDYERNAFMWIVGYTQNLLLAITVVLLGVFTFAHYVSIENVNILSKEWWPFYFFEFLSLGIGAALILTFGWLRTRKRLIIFRHFKTMAFSYMSFFFLSGLIVLAHNIYKELY